VIEHAVFGTLTGQVIDDVFTFTRAKDGNKYQVLRPQTWEVFAAAGRLEGGNEIEKAIGAQITAALNRHVALDSNVWGGDFTFCDPGRFYKSPPANYYAQFWHQNSIDNKAYGFDYDDVCRQSTLLESKQPTELEVSVGWN
jgi:glycosyl hydrolase family 64 (putative beta-1,3-glucanase)